MALSHIHTRPHTNSYTHFGCAETQHAHTHTHTHITPNFDTMQRFRVILDNPNSGYALRPSKPGWTLEMCSTHFLRTRQNPFSPRRSLAGRPGPDTCARSRYCSTSGSRDTSDPTSTAPRRSRPDRAGGSHQGALWASNVYRIYTNAWNTVFIQIQGILYSHKYKEYHFTLSTRNTVFI